MPKTEIDSYLHFNGNCAKAMRFYADVLGGEIQVMMTGGESPVREHIPAECHDQTLHASLVVGDRRLMASDWMVPTPYPGMSGFSVALNYATAEEARRVFDALSEGGKVTMPFGRTFWSEGFGMLTDRFGTPWMVSGPAPLES